MYCGSRDIEDTYHLYLYLPFEVDILINFTLYDHLVLKFNLLMGSINKNVLINLAKYIRVSLDIRKSIQI